MDNSVAQAASRNNRALSVGFCAVPALVCLLAGAVEAKLHMLLFGVAWSIWAVVNFRYPQRFDMPLREAFRVRAKYDRPTQRLSLVAHMVTLAACIVWVAQ